MGPILVSPIPYATFSQSVEWFMPDRPDLPLYRFVNGINRSNKRLLPAPEGFVMAEVMRKILRLKRKRY